MEPPFKSEEFEEAWAGFMEMRAKTKHPLTLYAIKLLFRDFKKFPEKSVIEALERSIINNWRGVFPEGKSDRRFIV